MKFTADRRVLLETVAAAAKACPRNTPKPILNSIRLDVSDNSLSVRGTNLDLEIAARCPIESNFRGAVLLPAQRAMMFLRTCTDDAVLVSSTDSGVAITCGRARLTAQTENPDEFPGAWAIDGAAWVTDDSLCRAIRFVEFCTDHDTSRYALSAIELTLGEVSAALATDGSRLALAPFSATSNAAAPGAVLVPHEPARLIASLFSGRMEVRKSAASVQVSNDSLTVHARLMEGRFPKCRDVIPRSVPSASCEIPTQALIEAFAQAAVASADSKDGQFTDPGKTNLSFSGGVLRISCRHEASAAEAEVPIRDDVKCETTLKTIYLRQALSVVADYDTVTINMYGNGDGPVVIDPGDGRLQLAMPLAKDR